MKQAAGPTFSAERLASEQLQKLMRMFDQIEPLTKLITKSWTDPGNDSEEVDRPEYDRLVELRSAAHGRRVVLAYTTAAGLECMSPL